MQAAEPWSEDFEDRLVKEYLDKTENVLPIPTKAPASLCQSHILQTMARREHMECLNKFLKHNYTANQGRIMDTRVSNAILRCAKDLEMSAAKKCMTVPLYLGEIVSVIKEVRRDTQEAKLNKTLIKYLFPQPSHDKTVKRKGSPILQSPDKMQTDEESEIISGNVNCDELYKIPAPKRRYNGPAQLATPRDFSLNTGILEPSTSQVMNPTPNIGFAQLQQETNMLDANDNDIFDTPMRPVFNKNTNDTSHSKLVNPTNTSLFGNASGITFDTSNISDYSSDITEYENNAYGLKNRISGDTYENRQPYQMNSNYQRMDGCDSVGVMQPLASCPNFVNPSEKRIKTWVMALLLQYHVVGRIRSQSLLNSLANHLICLISQGRLHSDYNEVNDYVMELLEHHQMIMCEADFK